MAIYLVCEGPTDGLDVRVLNIVIAQKLQRAVKIEPAGGESSLGSVATYIEDRSRQADRAFTIEDRDYRPLQEVESTWRDSRQKRLRWRRHEIENYLLDPRIVSEAFQGLKRDEVSGADRLPDNSAAVFAVLQEVARPMLEGHAGWLAFWHLVTVKDQAAMTWFKGGHPQPTAGRAQWVSYLREECDHLKAACSALAIDPVFDDPVAVYDVHLAEVSDSAFFASEQFISEVSGHGLLSGLCSFINHLGLSRLSRADLRTELVNALDRLYAPGFFQPDDFDDLAQRLV